MLITISRQFGAGGSEVARRVAEALEWRVVDNELIEQVAARAGLPAARVAERDERCPTFVERLARTLAAATPEVFPSSDAVHTMVDLPEAELVRITETVVREAAARGRVVVVGRAAPAVLERQANALHVKLVAPRAWRIEVAAARLGVPLAQAAAVLDDTDKMRARIQPRVLPAGLERPGALPHGAEHGGAGAGRGDGGGGGEGAGAGVGVKTERRKDGRTEGLHGAPSVFPSSVFPSFRHPNEIPPFPYPGSRRSGFIRV